MKKLTDSTDSAIYKDSPSWRRGESNPRGRRCKPFPGTGLNRPQKGRPKRKPRAT